MRLFKDLESFSAVTAVTRIHLLGFGSFSAVPSFRVTLRASLKYFSFFYKEFYLMHFIV